ncbi:heterokaryon incompatibility protein-domain-containing protein [Xylariales sp. PMI_506]|nr:heterokaryon incompatibility protein-domain-containing protein [Xylariales sp. PMI_506]
MDNSAARVFQSLNSSEPQFRLLHLQPTNVDEQENEFTHIVGTLTVESIHDAPVYEALSYVWGDASDCVNVTINSLDFPVTRNLYQALKHLVLADKVRVLWVDAVCINQSDLDERSQQVKQMRHIYKNAKSVSVFLGDPYDGIEMALQCLALAAKDGSGHIQPGLHPQLSVGNFDASSNELALALVKLFYLPWWRRLWTVQEFLLAREVVFRCGQHIISASVLTRGAKNLIEHGHSCCDPDSGSFSRRFTLDDNERASHNVWQGLNNLLGLMVSTDGGSFHWILSIYRMRLCTDSRDRLYGLFGLALDQLHDHFPVDYTATIEDVFETFTIQYVRHTKNLGLLGALGGQRQLVNLPSFCPDWTILPGADTSDDETMMLQLSNRIAVQPLYLGKKGLTEPKWRQTDRGSVTANGFIFDVIRDVSPECFRRPREKTRQWAKSILAMAKHVDKASLLKALCGGLIWSRDDRNYALIQDSEEGFEARLEKWWDWLLSDGTSSIVRDKDVIGVEQAVLLTCTGRSFVVTEKGYIGYADQHCRPGHVISILGGGYTPFILASKPSGYQVIGDAYIHGIMQGQAFALAGRQPGEFDEIVLV